MITNTAQGGGESAKLNVFCQPNLPTDKFDGILLQTPQKETLKKILYDNNIWSAGQWQNPSTIANLPAPRENFACATVDGKVYLFGGYSGSSNYYSSAIKYDPATNTYSSIADLPQIRSTTACTVYHDEIYIFGGYSPVGYTATALKYAPSTDTYTSLADMPTQPMYKLMCAAVKDKIYVFGGTYQDPSNQNIYPTSSSMHEYDPATDTYKSLASLPQGRDSAMCTSVGDDIYTFGGEDAGSTFFSSTLKYTPSTSTYTSLADMPMPRANGCCTAVGNAIYIFGGSCNNNLEDNGYMYSVIKYDIATNTYTDIPRMTYSRVSPGCAFVNNIIYAFGGMTNTDHNYMLLNVGAYMFTAKQYPDSPTFILCRLPQDTTAHRIIITKTKNCPDGITTDFYNAALFENGNITFPPLYVGDGSAWNKIREAQ